MVAYSMNSTVTDHMVLATKNTILNCNAGSWRNSCFHSIHITEATLQNIANHITDQ